MNWRSAEVLFREKDLTFAIYERDELDRMVKQSNDAVRGQKVSEAFKSKAQRAA